ncbi:DEAD/DEAH box helicase [Pacificibacter sp. AS14]|uniref:DEAD/DEAH box helicase n=1 Tax=Pacificibacter sp. AS14 TaxID=3135785 RepID=UPI00317BE47B
MTSLILSEVRADSIVLVPAQAAKGIFRRFQRSSNPDLTVIHQDDQALTYALARVRSLDPDRTQSVVKSDSLTLSHRLVAQIEDAFAAPLGLPPLIHGLSFAAKMQGTIGSADARLAWWWERNGRKESVPRTGTILFPEISERRMRIPDAIYQAIRLAEKFDPAAPIESHWRALATYKTFLGNAAGTVLDPFLEGLKIVSVGRLSLEVIDPEDHRFAPIPVSTNEDEFLLSPSNTLSFQAAVNSRGEQPTYRLADGTFAVIDRSAAPVLKVIADAMKDDIEGRKSFIDDAPRLIAEAVEQQFRDTGTITDETPPETAVELVERTVDEGWTETTGWSDRVIGVGVVAPAPSEIDEGSGLPWLPPTMSPTVGECLGALADEEVSDTILMLQRALLAGDKSLDLHTGTVPVTAEVIEALKRREALLSEPAPIAAEPAEAYLPIVHANLHDLDYFADVQPRSGSETKLPEAVSADLRGYQTNSFFWQVDAWKAGLPGVLNADEQGLGKTLQTLSFLSWLNHQMEIGEVEPAPVLIVAPTSLLRNWQAEINLHLAQNALGPIHQLYGTALSGWRNDRARGKDIGDGTSHLDLSLLHGKRGVIITTYQTLANYAVSFAGLKCATAVFDEMQFIKNPRTQRAQAAKAVQADFWIGLTGTPIENKTQDLWSILDVICPGALGPLATFNRVFAKPSANRLAQLQQALFQKSRTRPALCLRRTKIEADPTIPPKVRIMYPRQMPPAQAIRYNEARAKQGGILQVLQHIRRISAHPGMIEGELINDFVGASARTSVAMDVLRFVKSKGERALVFVENRDIQAWFIEILNLEFDLNVMLINGDTSIDDRQWITERFQRDRGGDDGFDVLVLGPRAAGTGLTLTAANHVVHLTRWWNPAVEEQCNDRTHRIGQSRPVTVHLPMAVHPDLGPASFDCLLHRLISRKIGLASNVLRPSDVDEYDLKQLHDASVLGRVVDEAPQTFSLADGLPDRSDIRITSLADDIIRVSSNDWPNRLVVAAYKDIATLSPYVDKHTDHVISIMPPDESGVLEGHVPATAVKDSRLWPDFLVPF